MIAVPVRYMRRPAIRVWMMVSGIASIARGQLSPLALQDAIKTLHTE